MNFAELTIIYLACGSPFGVQFVLRETDRSFFHTLAGVALRFFFWPVAAIAMLLRPSNQRSSLSFAYSNDELERIRSEMELIVQAGPSTTSVFELRETFLRYAGLASAADRSEVLPGTANLFIAAGHPDRALASACLQRKIAQKLADHRSRSRKEFKDLIAQLAFECRVPRVLALGIEAAESLGDNVLAAGLRWMTDRELTRSPAGSEPIGELWNTAQQHRSIAN